MDFGEYRVKVYKIFFDSDTKGPLLFDGVLPYLYLDEIIRTYGTINYFIEIKRKED